MIFSTLPSQQPFTYTWATKPPAAGNAGLEIIVSDFANSRWRSDGTYWRPSNGIAAIVAADLAAYSTTSTTLAAIAIPTSIVPMLPVGDLLMTPGLAVRTSLSIVRTAPANTQPRTLQVSWTAYASGSFLYDTRILAQQLEYTYGVVYRSSNSGAAYQGSATNQVPFGYFGTATFNANPDASVMQPLIRANTGGSGETLTLRNLIMEVVA